MNDTVQYTGALATQFESTLGKLRNYDSEVEFIKGFLLPTNNKTETFIDLGCGIGKHLFALRDSYSLGVGIDITPEMLESARLRLGNGVKLIQADLTAGIPLPQESSNLVVGLFNLFQSLAVHRNLEFLFAETNRILRVGGLLVCDFHNEALLSKKYPYGSTRRIQFEDGTQAKLTATISGQIKTLQIEFQDRTGKGIQSTAHKLKVVTLDEVRSLLNKFRFNPIEVFGGFNHTPFDEQTSERFVCAAYKSKD